MTDTDSSRVRWRRSVAAGLSSPTVVDGAVYVGSAQNLYALNAATGARRWDFTTSAPGALSPVVVDKVVYLCAGDDVYALNTI
ncbi:outer membrane protein assembly factor BamB family protein [Embleya sp. NPDC001921]